MPSTTDKILNTAMDCFFQHGYDTANISMVSRYAGISRVTIHKQFKSKELLFRAVVEKHFQQHNVLINIYSKSEINFWQETRVLIIQRCEGLFNHVSSSLVRANLLHAGQAFCKDLIQAEEGLIKNSIQLRIEKEISSNRLTLSKIDLSASALAEILHFAPFGITVSVSDQNNTTFVENLMAVFKASTSPF
ncbi:TetR/AcrR family transcriptional regulator [Colwellia sp. C1TZA3]|uniref:TetR/AcrR family transcriptional regulator n=1 Tax=Colwellia sp. C1TZA3 TaxID=2508879 RepID=UPI0011BA3612|nr:TetR/AcrR family transcriptional regulator [Colwellia sp. C1TZA3]TWX67031.1 TetR/AcrR family transcriptional regulator [Colwellia sp. C1TZA3]